MESWKLWRAGEVAISVSGFTPLLASWDAKTNPSQIRLTGYRDDLMNRLGPLPSSSGNLSLHLTVDVQNQSRLLHHHDLENYLTPLFQSPYLNPSDFRLVTAVKRVGGGSRIEIGHATPLDGGLAPSEWGHFESRVGSGLPERKDRKLSLKQALLEAGHTPMPPGQVQVQLAWRCSSKRNWTMLWKPTGDTMGPVLGEDPSRGDFNPFDDRITSLGMHLNVDDSIGWDVDVGMWWKQS